VHGIVADLGLGSHHIDDGARGFSFRREGPLDMRYAAGGGEGEGEGEGGEGAGGGNRAGAGAGEGADALTAADVASRWPYLRLRRALAALGGLPAPAAAAVAKGIVAWRGAGHRARRIVSTLELRLVVEEAMRGLEEGPRGGAGAGASAGVGAGKGKDGDGVTGKADARSKVVAWRRRESRLRDLRGAAARRPAFPDAVRGVFQALRVAVNDELSHVERLLRAAPALLARGGGRLAVLAFQPDEDAPVAAALAALAAPRAGFRLVTAAGGAAVRPALEEVRENRRARSAHLRVLERLGGEAEAGAGAGAGAEGEEEGAGGAVAEAEAEAEAARVDRIVANAVVGLIKRVPPEEAPPLWRARSAAPAGAGESEGDGDDGGERDEHVDDDGISGDAAAASPRLPRRGRVRAPQTRRRRGGADERGGLEEDALAQSFRWMS
jgi:hypothetical protein